MREEKDQTIDNFLKKNRTGNNRLERLYYNDKMLGLISTYPMSDNNILIDAGANDGLIYRHWALLNPARKIVAIDPTNYSYEQYAKNKFQNVKFIQTAISNIKATAIDFIEVIPNYGRSGIEATFYWHQLNFARNQMLDGRLPELFGSNPSVTKEIKVPCDTLDNIFAKELDNIGLIKMDIEGGEYLAMKGAEQILKKSRPLISIEPPAIHPNYRSNLISIINFFDKHNYKLKDIYGYSIYNQIHNLWCDWLYYPEEKQDIVNFVNDIFIKNIKPQNFKMTTILGNHNRSEYDQLISTYKQRKLHIKSSSG